MSTGNEEGFTIPEITFGRRLRLAREKAGLSTEGMAAELGVTPQAVSHWENNVRTPRKVFDVVSEWARVTKTPEVWLLTGTKGTSG